MRDPPDQDALLELHVRLLRGDRLASEEVVRSLLPHLQSKIARKFPLTDEQLISDGVIDAVLDYCAHPQQFDADKGASLEHFLCGAAWRNVANLCLGERRRKTREKKVGGKKPEANVALDPVARNIQQEEQREAEKRLVAMLAALPDPLDQQILMLKLQGEKDTAVFAPLLGVAHLPRKQQEEEVKRHKDRITRFLRRKGLLP